MQDKWIIFCEESGDKQMPWKTGSSDFYIVTAILVREENERELIDLIAKYKYEILRLKAPLEWKKLRPRQKRDDVLLGRFLKKLDEATSGFFVSSVICNKHETKGQGFGDRNTFMNYLYGLMFKRICWFLKTTGSSAKLIIDRNTDQFSQSSLQQYITMIAKIRTGQAPRHPEPRWINPEEHAILGLADFVAGVSLRALESYWHESDQSCRSCVAKKNNCLYLCDLTGFGYQRSYHYIMKWNYTRSMVIWDWKGLLYHPFENKDNYRHIFQPR